MRLWRSLSIWLRKKNTRRCNGCGGNSSKRSNPPRQSLAMTPKELCACAHDSLYMNDLYATLIKWANAHHGFYPPFWGLKSPHFEIVLRDLAQLSNEEFSEAEIMEWESFMFRGVLIIKDHGNLVTAEELYARAR